MVVYVINKNGKPLMPCKPQKARKLLKEKKAKVIKKCPFTIQLKYPCRGHVQKNTLKVDAGSKHIGLSVVSQKSDKVKKELYSGEVEIRSDIVELLSTRREARRTRRNRKTRYRPPRFKNRKNKKKGWIAPSIRNKIQTHITVIQKICKLLPIDKIIVEVASFDVQKIKNKNIKGKEYQEGEQKGFGNVRQYVLFRDNYTCQCCKNKKGDKILGVHHLQSRKTGGNAPNNLITLCNTCHIGYHQGKVQLPEDIERDDSFRDATFMGIMRNTLYEKLVSLYGKDKVLKSYGYITKENRITNHLPKTHRVDALCIEEPNAKDVIPLDVYYYERKVRCHNRQLHKQNILKGGRRKLNQAPYKVHGFCLFDKVLYHNQVCFISGRRSNGYFKLITLSGEVVHASASYKALTLLEHSTGFLIEMHSNTNI